MLISKILASIVTQIKKTLWMLYLFNNQKDYQGYALER